MPYNTKNRYEQGQALRKEIYMYIVSYIKLVGYAPSITEISEKSRCRESYGLETYQSVD